MFDDIKITVESQGLSSLEELIRLGLRIAKITPAKVVIKKGEIEVDTKYGATTEEEIFNEYYKKRKEVVDAAYRKTKEDL